MNNVTLASCADPLRLAQLVTKAKICRVCRVLKELKEFNRDKYARDQTCNICRDCARQESKQRRLNNKSMSGLGSNGQSSN